MRFETRAPENSISALIASYQQRFPRKSCFGYKKAISLASQQKWACLVLQSEDFETTCTDVSVQSVPSSDQLLDSLKVTVLHHSTVQSPVGVFAQQSKSNQFEADSISSASRGQHGSSTRLETAKPGHRFRTSEGPQASQQSSPRNLPISWLWSKAQLSVFVEALVRY